VTYGRALNDVGVAFVNSVEEAGGNDDDARRIFKDNVLRRNIGLLVMGKLQLKQFPCQIHCPDLIPEGYEVLEDVERHEFKVSDLEFPSFLRDGDGGYIDGELMRKRAVEIVANYGLSDVPTLLGKDGKGLGIPEELRGNNYIVLSGTLLRDPDGGLCVPFLYWSGDRWILLFRQFGLGWYGDGRLVRSKQL